MATFLKFHPNSKSSPSLCAETISEMPCGIWWYTFTVNLNTNLFNCRSSRVILDWRTMTTATMNFMENKHTNSLLAPQGNLWAHNGLNLNVILLPTRLNCEIHSTLSGLNYIQTWKHSCVTFLPIWFWSFLTAHKMMLLMYYLVILFRKVMNVNYSSLKSFISKYGSKYLMYMNTNKTFSYRLECVYYMSIPCNYDL